MDHDGGGIDPEYRLSVSLHAGMARHRRDDLVGRIAIRVGLIWTALAFLLIAWLRSLRSRDLAAALDREQDERERLEELNLAAAGLAHETKNPLGIIRGVAQRLAAETQEGDPAHHAAEEIMDEADRASARLNDFMNFAGGMKPVLSNVDVGKLVRRVVQTLGHDFAASNVTLELALAEGCVLGDEGMLEQIVVNLLLNSLQACTGIAGAKTKVSFTVAQSSGTLEVADTGAGIPESLKREIFKPYVSGRSDGHGLGLAVVRRIVDQHGWLIEARSPSAGGTILSIQKMTLIETFETHGHRAPAQRGEADDEEL